MARSQAALGQAAAARSSASTAVATLDALVTAARPPGRDLLLAQAQALACLASLERSGPWRERALATYAQAAQTQPLGPDDAALRQALAARR